MQNNKFLVFLLISLALTAFLAGYVLVGQEVKTNAKQNTGTLLDRFDSQNTIYPENTLTVSELPLPVVIQTFLNLNPNISSFAFSPNNDRVAYFVYQKNKNGESGTVFVSKSDGSNPQILLTTRTQVVTLSWPEENKVSVEINPLKEPIILKVIDD